MDSIMYNVNNVKIHADVTDWVGWQTQLTVIACQILFSCSNSDK